MSQIYVIKGIEELGLVPASSQVLHIIPDKKIEDIELHEKEKFINLLDKFGDIFAMDEFNLEENNFKTTKMSQKTMSI